MPAFKDEELEELGKRQSLGCLERRRWIRVVNVEDKCEKDKEFGRKNDCDKKGPHSSRQVVVMFGGQRISLRAREV